MRAGQGHRQDMGSLCHMWSLLVLLVRCLVFGIPRSFVQALLIMEHMKDIKQDETIYLCFMGRKGMKGRGDLEKNSPPVRHTK